MGQQRKRKNMSQQKLSKEEEQKRREQNLENYHRKKQGTCLFLLSLTLKCVFRTFTLKKHEYSFDGMESIMCITPPNNLVSTPKHKFVCAYILHWLSY